MTQYPIDVAVNPNDDSQRYILWTNGRIDSEGGAPTITGPGWYDRVDTVAMALHITDWVAGKGYVLDWQGGFNPLGGAPDLMTDEVQYAYKSVPGVPYQLFRCYIDWDWDPDGSGQGYVLDLWGQIYAFGGATDAPRTGPRFTVPIARRLEMQWSPTKYAITMDMHGGLYGDFGLSLPTDLGNHYDGSRDWARDLAITDWSTAPRPKGYTLDMTGVTWPFAGAPVGGAPGGVFQNADVARTLRVLDVADPTRMWQVWSGGQQYEYVFSTPPSVTAGGAQGSPSSTVTDTTRPVLAWSYSDPQNDSQQAWQLLVFTQAFVDDGHPMTDPLEWSGSALVAAEGSVRTTRGLTCPVDLANGTYRMYVRAQDTSGMWSPWDDLGWAQDVAVPATPTGLTATADDDTLTVALSVTASTDNNGDLVRFDSSDDGGSTWTPVPGADAVPLETTTTATDQAAPLGKTRTYRATAYSTAPAVASAPSATASATVAATGHVLTAVDNAALGGRVKVTDPPQWGRQSVAGVFQGIGAKYPVVVSDGEPKAQTATITLMAMDADAWEQLVTLLEANSTLIYRDPFGQVVYCRLVGSWTRQQIKAAPLASESTPLRHLHTTALPIVEVAPPVSTSS